MSTINVETEQNNKLSIKFSKVFLCNLVNKQIPNYLKIAIAASYCADDCVTRRKHHLVFVAECKTKTDGLFFFWLTDEMADCLPDFWVKPVYTCVCVCVCV